MDPMDPVDPVDPVDPDSDPQHWWSDWNNKTKVSFA